LIIGFELNASIASLKLERFEEEQNELLKETKKA